jgi:hypothetical protein
MTIQLELVDSKDSERWGFTHTYCSWWNSGINAFNGIDGEFENYEVFELDEYNKEYIKELK